MYLLYANFGSIFSLKVGGLLTRSHKMFLPVAKLCTL